MRFLTGILLPGGVMVARLVLAQLVQVRVLAGQPFLTKNF